MTPLPPNSTIGMLGGGQLGRMMALAAARLGYRVAVLDPDPDAPAAAVSAAHIRAPFEDSAALDRLAAACAVVTYEWENVPVPAVRRLSARVPVFPPAGALEVAQDRLAEKTFLNNQGIPTAAFRAVDGDAELGAALEAFGSEGILKTRRGGYDGRGQRRFRSGDDPAGAFEALGGVPLILEGVVPFEREISVIGARTGAGAFAVYDAAENSHENGILRRSTVPAFVGPATAFAARDATRRIVDALDYVGVIGVEFFVLADGGLVANEIAPRVHNSGHWTEAACAVSQFEQHVRAVCGLPLGDGRRLADCAMENLLGSDVFAAPELLAEPDAVVHIYGKTDARPGRKMGHVTRLAPRP